MSARITKSRDPILSALRAEYLAALDFSRLAFDADEWDAAIDRVNKTRVAVNKREELYTPKRERKARRKKGELSRWRNRLAKGPEPRHPLSSMYFFREMGCARSYIKTLTSGQAHHTLKNEFIDEAKLCLWWAKTHRIQAAALGRRLP